MTTNDPARERKDVREATPGRAPFSLWVLLMALIAVHSTWTLHFSPKLNRDESEIVEYGRVIMNPGTDWSCIETPAGRSEAFFGYASAIVHELAYRMTNHHDAPRLLALAGLLVAACAALWWLRERGCDPWLAGSVALLLAVDPIFETAVRYGRPDSWTCALLMAACALVRVSARQQGRRATQTLVIAGMLAGFSPWLWPTAVITAPVVLAEFIDCQMIGKRTGGWRKLGILALAGAAGLALGAVPMGSRLVPAFDAMMRIVNWNTGANTAAQAMYVLKDIVWLAVSHPFFLMLAVVGAIERRMWPWTALTVALFGCMLVTRIYDSRYLYLIPALIPLCANGAAMIAARTARMPGALGWTIVLSAFGSCLVMEYRFLYLVPLLLGPVVWLLRDRLVPASMPVVVKACLPALVGALWWTGAVRDYSAWRHAPHQDFAAITAKFEEAVGKGPRIVYTPYSLYFTGRKLGWKMNRYQLVEKEDTMKTLFEKCEWIILDEDATADKRLGPAALASGFEPAGIPSLGHSSFMFRGGGYGPYQLFKRANRSAPDLPPQ